MQITDQDIFLQAFNSWLNSPANSVYNTQAGLENIKKIALEFFSAKKSVCGSILSPHINYTQKTQTLAAINYESAFAVATKSLEQLIEQWKKNSSLTQDQGRYDRNLSLLQMFITCKKSTKEDIVNFFKGTNINPEGGWFYDSRKQPTECHKLLLKKFQGQYTSAKHLYDQVVKEQGAIFIKSPKERLITLNCHGSFSNHTFTLPKNVYVLVPHREGFAKPFVFAAPSNIHLEERIYANEDDKVFPESSKGWHLYKPAEKIHNVQLKGWRNTKEEGFENWKSKVPQEDIDQVLMFNNNKIPEFEITPARDKDQKILSYKGLKKKKVKVFGPTNLEK